MFYHRPAGIMKFLRGVDGLVSLAYMCFTCRGSADLGQRRVSPDYLRPIFSTQMLLFWGVNTIVTNVNTCRSTTASVARNTHFLQLNATFSNQKGEFIKWIWCTPMVGGGRSIH